MDPKEEEKKENLQPWTTTSRRDRVSGKCLDLSQTGSRLRRIQPGQLSVSGFQGFLHLSAEAIVDFCCAYMKASRNGMEHELPLTKLNLLSRRP
jgi:hypothetical protein